MLPGTGGELLDHGNAGTSMRLSMGALAGRVAAARQIGDASLSIRPMERVAVPLRQMGASVSTVDGHAPVTVRGVRPLRPLHHDLPVASAQVLGAVTLAALAADGHTTITTPGPTRDHTERMLALARRAGRTGRASRPRIDGSGGLRRPGHRSCPATSPRPRSGWRPAALHPDGHVRLRGVGLNPSRTAIIDVLREMGVDIAVVEGDPTRRRAGGRPRRPWRRHAPGDPHRRRPRRRPHRRAAAAGHRDGSRGRAERAARCGRAARQGVGSHRARRRRTCRPSASTPRSCPTAGG